MAGEAQLEMPLHVRPFVRQDAVHHGVAHRPVAARRVVADHAVLPGAERLDRPLRGEVEVVRAQAHHLAAEGIERVSQQEPLARGVDVGPLPAPTVPGVADLDPIHVGDDVVIAGAADDETGRELTHRPGQHVPGLLAGERARDVAVRLLRLRNRREPELPEAPVRGGDRQRAVVLPRQGLQPHAVAFERDGAGVDHGRLTPDGSASCCARSSRMRDQRAFDSTSMCMSPPFRVVVERGDLQAAARFRFTTTSTSQPSTWSSDTSWFSDFVVFVGSRSL